MLRTSAISGYFPSLFRIFLSLLAYVCFIFGVLLGFFGFGFYPSFNICQHILGGYGSSYFMATLPTHVLERSLMPLFNIFQFFTSEHNELRFTLFPR